MRLGFGRRAGGRGEDAGSAVAVVREGRPQSSDRALVGLDPAPAELPAAPTGPQAAAARLELVRTMLVILFVAGLIAATFWILWPFLPAIIWATTLVVATWPLMLHVQHRLGNSRGLAVAVMTLALLLVFIVPFSLAVAAITQNFDRILGWAKALASFQLPPPPVWLAELPLFGSQLVELWQRIAQSGIDVWAAKAAPYAGSAAGWLFGVLGGFGIVVVQFLLTVVVAALLYAHGEQAAVAVRRFGHRLAGERGEEAVLLAGQAIRSVALGVVVTALIQSVLGGIGIALAGIPFFAIFTAAMFMLCIAQLGPGFVLIPAIVWLYWKGSAGWGTFLLVWSIVVLSLDNIVRPLLIRKGAHVPLLVLLAGVIGGLIAFGLVGVFIGPVVLAVAYTLLQAWMAEDRVALRSKER